MPQPPDSTPGCRGRSPPSSSPFPRPGKPGLRGQTRRSRSVSSTGRPPARLLHFRAFYGHRLRQGGSWGGFPACWVPARQGEGTLVGSPGDTPKAAHPPQPWESGPAMEQQHFGGTASGTLPSLLCACCHALRWMERGILPNIQQGCCEFHGVPNGGIVAQKGPHHGAGLNTPVQLWGEVPGSWWARGSGWVEGGKGHPKPSPPSLG